MADTPILYSPFGATSAWSGQNVPTDIVLEPEGVHRTLEEGATVDSTSVIISVPKAAVGVYLQYAANATQTPGYPSGGLFYYNIVSGANLVEFNVVTANVDLFVATIYLYFCSSTTCTQVASKYFGTNLGTVGPKSFDLGLGILNLNYSTTRWPVILIQFGNNASHSSSDIEIDFSTTTATNDLQLAKNFIRSGAIAANANASVKPFPYFRDIIFADSFTLGTYGEALNAYTGPDTLGTAWNVGTAAGSREPTRVDNGRLGAITFGRPV